MSLLPNSTEAGPGAPYWAAAGSGGGVVPANLQVSTIAVSSLGSFSTLNANSVSISSLNVSSINGAAPGGGGGNVENLVASTLTLNGNGNSTIAVCLSTVGGNTSDFSFSVGMNKTQSVVPECSLTLNSGTNAYNAIQLTSFDAGVRKGNFKIEQDFRGNTVTLLNLGSFGTPGYGTNRIDMGSVFDTPGGNGIVIGGQSSINLAVFDPAGYVNISTLRVSSINGAVPNVIPANLSTTSASISSLSVSSISGVVVADEVTITTLNIKNTPDPLTGIIRFVPSNPGVAYYIVGGINVSTISYTGPVITNTNIVAIGNVQNGADYPGVFGVGSLIFSSDNSSWGGTNNCPSMTGISAANSDDTSINVGGASFNITNKLTFSSITNGTNAISLTQLLSTVSGGAF